MDQTALTESINTTSLMAAPDSYMTAWLIYIGCSLVVVLMAFIMTRQLQSTVFKAIIRMSVFVLMLFPYTIAANESLLAPAIIMFVMETLFEGNPSRVGIPFLSAWVVGMLCVVIIAILSRRKKVQAEQFKVLDKQRQELLQESLIQDGQRIEPTISD